MCVFPHGSRQFRRGVAFLIVAFLALACQISGWAEKPTPDLSAGKSAYEQSCARCHGATGKGDGIDAKRFYPRPRDFSLGEYKFRTTMSGTPPSDEDLFRTVTKGLPGSNMPDWQHLDEKTRWQIVYYLKTLSPVFQQAKPQPVAAARDPGPKRANIAKGKELYKQLGCAACHGAAGRANGASAAGLVDDWNMKIRPANLTQGWAYRGGADPESIMWRFMAGIEGAGMPSYAESGLAPQDAWHLAYYVHSLQEPAHWNMIAHPKKVDGALPASVDDPQWAAAEHTDLPTRNVVTAGGEWANPPTIRAVGVEALYNDRDIAFRLTWDDPTQEASAPSDGIALVFKPKGLEGDIVTLQAWPYQGAPLLDACYWSAEAGQVTEALASNFEQVRSRRPPEQALEGGVATYEDGRWRVVIKRPLTPALPDGAAPVTPERFHSVAVAVWDGGNPDARAVSYWVDLAFDSTKQHKQ